MSEHTSPSFSRRSLFSVGFTAAVALVPQNSDYVVAAPNEMAIYRGLASGASRLILPAGRIILSQTLRVTDRTSLIGAGAGRTIFEASPNIRPGQAMVEVVGDGVSLSNFSLEGRAQGGIGAGYGVQAYGSGHRFEALHVSDVAQTGFRLSISHSEISNCVAADCGRQGHTDNHGFMLYRSAHDRLGPLQATTFRRCRADNAYRKGFALYTDGPEISDVLFEECIASRCGLPLQSGGGFYLVPAEGQRMKRISVSDCDAEDNYVNYEIGPVSGLSLRDSRSARARATGYLIHGAHDIRMTGNFDENSGVDAVLFNDILGVSIGGRLAHNVMRNANRSAVGFASFINLSGAEEIVVSDNLFIEGDSTVPFLIYEGRRAGQNYVSANDHIRAG